MSLKNAHNLHIKQYFKIKPVLIAGFSTDGNASQKLNIKNVTFSQTSGENWPLFMHFSLDFFSTQPAFQILVSENWIIGLKVVESRHSLVPTFAMSHRSSISCVTAPMRNLSHRTIENTQIFSKKNMFQSGKNKLENHTLENQT